MYQDEVLLEYPITLGEHRGYLGVEVSRPGAEEIGTQQRYERYDRQVVLPDVLNVPGHVFLLLLEE